MPHAKVNQSVLRSKIGDNRFSPENVCENNSWNSVGFVSNNKVIYQEKFARKNVDARVFFVFIFCNTEASSNRTQKQHHSRCNFATTNQRFKEPIHFTPSTLCAFHEFFNFFSSFSLEKHLYLDKMKDSFRLIELLDI